MPKRQKAPQRKKFYKGQHAPSALQPNDDTELAIIDGQLVDLTEQALDKAYNNGYDAAYDYIYDGFQLPNISDLTREEQKAFNDGYKSGIVAANKTLHDVYMSGYSAGYESAETGITQPSADFDYDAELHSFEQGLQMGRSIYFEQLQREEDLKLLQDIEESQDDLTQNEDHKSDTLSNKSDDDVISFGSSSDSTSQSVSLEFHASDTSYTVDIDDMPTCERTPADTTADYNTRLSVDIDDDTSLHAFTTSDHATRLLIDEVDSGVLAKRVKTNGKEKPTVSHAEYKRQSRLTRAAETHANLNPEQESPGTVKRVVDTLRQAQLSVSHGIDPKTSREQARAQDMAEKTAVKMGCSQ